MDRSRVAKNFRCEHYEKILDCYEQAVSVMFFHVANGHFVGGGPCQPFILINNSPGKSMTAFVFYAKATDNSLSLKAILSDEAHANFSSSE
jgi:hypothetical protein